jgi:hypothetical protein
VADVFISYRRNDSAGYARWLYDALVGRVGEGHVFMDVDTIGPGEDFAERIEEALGASDVAIILIGRHWLADEHGVRRIDDPDDFVRLEVSAALRHTSVRVLPVLVDGATMPGRRDLPEELARLARLNAIELSAQHGTAAVKRPIATLGDTTALTGDAPPRAGATKPGRWGSRRLAAVALGAALLIALALVLVLRLAGSGGHSGARGASGTNGVTSTNVLIYTPADPSGAPLVPLSANLAGACFTGSIVAARAEAWRCSVAHTIHDPCFEAGPNRVICPTGGPWSGSAIAISLGVPLPRNHANPTRPNLKLPWAVQLVDGSQCLLVSGASTVVAGLRLNYMCGNHLELYGNPDRSSALWTVFAGRDQSTILGKRPISVVWF